MTVIAQTYQAPQSAVETMIRGMSWVSPETPPTHEAPEDAEGGHAFRSIMGEAMAISCARLRAHLAHKPGEPFVVVQVRFVVRG